MNRATYRHLRRRFRALLRHEPVPTAANWVDPVEAFLSANRCRPLLFAMGGRRARSRYAPRLNPTDTRRGRLQWFQDRIAGAVRRGDAVTARLLPRDVRRFLDRVRREVSSTVPAPLPDLRAGCRLCRTDAACWFHRPMTPRDPLADLTVPNVRAPVAPAFTVEDMQ